MAPTNQREHGYFPFCNFLTNSLHWNSEGKQRGYIAVSVKGKPADRRRCRGCCVGSGERSADMHRRRGCVAGLRHGPRLEAWSSRTQMSHPNQTGHTAWGWPALQSQQGKSRDSKAERQCTPNLWTFHRPSCKHLLLLPKVIVSTPGPWAKPIASSLAVLCLVFWM